MSAHYVEKINDNNLSRHQPESSVFVCHLCNKVLSNKNNLKMHYRVHTGERPYKCKFCNYRATKAFNLKSHIMRKHVK